MESDKYLIEMGYAIRKRVTAREEFLRTMNYVIPWTEWVDYVRPFAPAENDDDRQVLLLLRMYLLQHWFGIEDARLEDAIYDSYAMWLFMGINTMAEESLPARTAYAAFRQALERGDTYVALGDAIDNFLRRYGRKIVRGSMVEAAIVEDDGLTPPGNFRPFAPPEREGHAARQWSPPHAGDEESEAIRRLEERLNRLETVETPPAPARQPAPPDDDVEDDPPRRNGWFGRALLILLVLAFLAGAAYSIYDYLQTGEWFRWLPRGTGPVAAMETIEPTPTARTTLYQQVIMPTPASAVSPQPTRTVAPATGLTFSSALPAAEGSGTLLQQVLQTAAPAQTGTSMPGAVLGGIPYDATEEIAQSLARLAAGTDPATIVDREAAPDKKISITFDGMYEAETMREILGLLARHNIAVTFYPTGLQTADTPELVREIAEAGHAIGNYTLRGETAMQTQAPQALAENFTIAGKIIGVVTGVTPTRMKANATEYTPALLAAAAASGIQEVVQSTAYITHHSFKRYDEALAYVNRLPYGSIVSIKLSGKLDASEYQPLEIIEEAALDKEASALAEESAVEGLSEAERLLLVVQWLLEAVDNADYSPESTTLREANGGALADTTRLLRTTQPAVAYTFYGDYGRPEEVQAVLDSLARIGGVGTFFVSLEDIETHQDALQAILDGGHSVGLSIIPYASAQEYYAASYQMLQARAMMEASFGYTPRLVLQGGSATDALREAASSLDMLLVGADLTLTREDARDAATPQEVIDAVFGESPAGFQRGKILRIQLGYMASETVLGELILALEGTRNAYAVVDLYGMATNDAFLYAYPLADEDILPEVRGRVHPGQLTATGDDFIAFATEHYIGNPDISDEKRLPGFTRQEIYRLDIAGRIPGVRGVAFLTFDDWGTDVGVTKLLDVLRAHGVKATFFVRTNYVDNNPNLLRAIAMEGHEIASHTHTHMQLANENIDSWTFTNLTDAQYTVLQDDLQASWDVLEGIVGDIRLDNGRPALSTLFRPPTLAISRRGMEAVYDMGMTYIVSGDFTSQDYKATDVDSLRRSLRLNIWDGSVAVMHFSDNSIYTADALDEYLTLNAAGENRKIYTYARLSDYLVDAGATQEEGGATP